MLFILSIMPLVLGMAVVIMALIRKLKPLPVVEENRQSGSEEILTVRILSSSDQAENVLENIPDQNRLKVLARSTED